MGHFDDIRSSLADADYESLNRPQVEAIVDAMMLVMVSEGAAPEKEQSELDKTLEELEERAHFSVASYLSKARKEARELVADSASIQRKVDEIADRLDDETLVEEAYYLAARISAIDAEVVPDETDVLTTLVDTFDIPRERMKLLTRRLRHQV